MILLICFNPEYMDRSIDFFAARNINKYQWAVWEEWTDCSQSCGRSGIKTRTRKCMEPIKNQTRCPKKEEIITETCGKDTCSGIF